MFVLHDITALMAWGRTRLVLGKVLTTTQGCRRSGVNRSSSPLVRGDQPGPSAVRVMEVGCQMKAGVVQSHSTCRASSTCLFGLRGHAVGTLLTAECIWDLSRAIGSPRLFARRSIELSRGKSCGLFFSRHQRRRVPDHRRHVYETALMLSSESAAVQTLRSWSVFQAFMKTT